MVIEALLPSLFSSDLTGDAQGRRGTLIKKKKRKPRARRGVYIYHVSSPVGNDTHVVEFSSN
jgi:hypothetical protein